uniref:Ubiquitin-like protease family profile domain-containing protein n=1 Tax=Brassica oleracea var. oleracea TaxID=109376 RepID=A0A0D3DIT1_BRAOL
MAHQFPKRILQEGAETQIDKINNTCRRTLLEAVKGSLNDEYEEVLKDPVFGPLLAIIENKLIYSGKIIHSFMCKQLRVSKLHELWLLLRRGLLEEPDVDFINWKNDNGFWSNALKTNAKINLYTIRDELLKVCNEWTYMDRVYLSIIQSFLMAKDWKVYIPQEYIRLVMDFEKLRMYPWGLRAYDELIASILRAREDVHTKNSYVLDGFSYAFQIWIMEAIPDIGSMVGKKIKTNMKKMRCRNWKGSGKVSYQDITSLESHFDKGEVLAFISSTCDFDVIDNTEFVREDEKKDERVGSIVELINAKQDWKQFDWEVEALPAHMDLSDSEHDEDVTETHVEEPADVAEEPVVAAKRGKRKLIDHGAESRKKQLMCQRAAEHNSGVPGDMNTFIEGLFTTSFNSFKEVVQKDIHEHFDYVANEVAQLKEQVSQIKGLFDTVGKGNTSEIMSPSATLGKDQGQSSHSTGPPAAKGKGKASAMWILLRFVVALGQYVDKGTQDSLQEAMGNISQASHVKGFDPSQHLDGDEPADFVTPLSSFKPADWRPPTLKDVDSHEDRIHDPDYSLEIDGMMWLFTERTSLRRWFPNKVAFMTCLFSNQITNSYNEYKKDKKKFKVTGLLQQYGVGELPAHGRTRLMWDLDVNRMYVPLNVGKHWISMCVNFVTRSIEVFDCEGLRHPGAVEPFAVLIPRVVKAVQSSKSRQHHVKQYTVSYASIPFLLNKSSSDCGVYALKYIECHLLGLDFSLVNDNNIREARQKIAYDLWEAAIDHVLIERMAKFTPPKTISSALVELE